MLRTETVVVPASTSGIWLTTELFPRLGIAQKIKVKVMPRGSDATAMVASGGADVAVQPVSEIVHAVGVDLVGSLQFVQVFSAAVVANSGEIEKFQTTDRISFLFARFRGN